MGSGRWTSCVRTCLLMRHTCNHFEPSLSCDLGKDCSCFDLSWQHGINKICTGNPICGLPHAADVEHVTNDYIRSLISEGSRPFVILPNKSLHFVSAFQQQLNGRTTCVSCGSGLCAPANSKRRRRLAAALPVLISISNSGQGILVVSSPRLSLPVFTRHHAYRHTAANSRTRVSGRSNKTSREAALRDLRDRHAVVFCGG
jgi:hypothetical protein